MVEAATETVGIMTGVIVTVIAMTGTIGMNATTGGTVIAITATMVVIATEVEVGRVQVLRRRFRDVAGKDLFAWTLRRDPNRV